MALETRDQRQAPAVAPLPLDFRVVYESHARAVRRFLGDLLRDDSAADEATQETFVRAWPDMPVFDDAGAALSTLRERGWRLAFLTNCDEDLFATTRSRLPVPFDEWVTAEEVRSYKPDLAHFRRFAEKTGVTRADWIHVANSWILDILPSARMGLRCVWVDRDLTGHPAKLADRRVTSMRRLPEAVSDVNAIPPRAQ